MAELEKILAAAVKLKASDVHVSPGEPYMLRRLGKLVKVKGEMLDASRCSAVISEILNEEQRKMLREGFQLDFAVEISDVGRFRGSAMMHNKGLSAAFRVIPKGIPTFEDLQLPETVARVLDNHQGLILVTGATGQGKSTTLAAMIDYINSRRSHHILTIEDPIEFIHPLKRGVVNQRQLGRDTLSYGNALRGALREDPDVIMIGELRDFETISLAISAAETGHLVLGTLSTSSAAKTVDRIIDSYPPEERNQIRAMLSDSIRAVITQRLIPGVEGDRMVPALEILIGTLSMVNLIRDSKTFQIPSMMQTGKSVGMKIMDESILTLLNEGKISPEEAVRKANDPRIFSGSDKKEGPGDSGE